MDTSNAALAVATVGLVPAIFGAALPPMSEVRGIADDRGHVAAAEQYAVLVSSAVVLGLAGVTRSPAVAIVGMVSVIGFASAYKLARITDPS